MKISIIGGGSYGATLAQVLTDNKHEVLVYEVNEQTVNNINNHFHPFLEEKLNDEIKATTDLKSVVDFSNYILLVVPTSVTRIVLEQMKPLITNKKVFINASKGIEDKTFYRVSEIVEDVIDAQYIEAFVSISGPSHAEELSKRMLTTLVSTSTNEEYAKAVQLLFNNSNYLRVYRNTDLIGAEMGGSLKNIYALASGILTGLGFGDNARAALMTRSLVEMNKIMIARGAKKETLIGLTGVGDLIVTCTSTNSRNFQAGYKIGSGTDYVDAINSMTMTVEGAKTCVAAYHLSKELNIDTPIIDATYEVVYHKKDPKIVISELLNRTLKEE